MVGGGFRDIIIGYGAVVTFLSSVRSVIVRYKRWF